jgi:Helix-turn-helix domain
LISDVGIVSENGAPGIFRQNAFFVDRAWFVYSFGGYMPRTEQTLDPLDGPLAAFAHDLRALREKAGHLPYRALARRAGFSASTLSVAASGKVLPSLDVTLAYVQACGGDAKPWRERWQVLAEQPTCRVTPVMDTAAVADAAVVPVRQGEQAAPSTALERVAWQLPDVTAATPVGIAVNNARRGVRRVYATLAAAAAMIVGFVLAAGAVGAHVVPSAPTLANKVVSQIGDLYGVIVQGAGLHSDANASADLRTQADWPRERNFLMTAANVRWQQAERVSTLDVSQIPDGALMAKKLHDSWANRTMADMFYAEFAGSPGESGSEPGTVSALDEAQAYDNAAQVSATEAVAIWNSHAKALGVPRISERLL